jgi:ankyrin repeat protein
MIRVLLRQRANPNAALRQGWAPLHLAGQNSCLSTVELLVENGSDLDMTNQTGLTPLRSSAQLESPAVANKLIELGPSPEPANING